MADEFETQQIRDGHEYSSNTVKTGNSYHHNNYWQCNEFVDDTGLEGQTNRGSAGCVALSSLSPSGLCDRCCAFFSTGMQDLISLQPQCCLHEAQHWKVREYNANWDTGELSMRSPTFLQEKKEKKCSSMMKLELNWSEGKTMSSC